MFKSSKIILKQKQSSTIPKKKKKKWKSITKFYHIEITSEHWLNNNPYLCLHKYQEERKIKIILQTPGLWYVLVLNLNHYI